MLAWPWAMASWPCLGPLTTCLALVWSLQVAAGHSSLSVGHKTVHFDASHLQSTVLLVHVADSSLLLVCAGRELGHSLWCMPTALLHARWLSHTAHNLLLPPTAHFCWLVTAHLVLATARWVATASHRPMLPGHGPLNMQAAALFHQRNKKCARTFINRIVG
jgi:hypothetical protein